jgi:hypothetical protein
MAKWKTSDDMKNHSTALEANVVIQILNKFQQDMKLNYDIVRESVKNLLMPQDINKIVFEYASLSRNAWMFTICNPMIISHIHLNEVVCISNLIHAHKDSYRVCCIIDGLGAFHIILFAKTCTDFLDGILLKPIPIAQRTPCGEIKCKLAIHSFVLVNKTLNINIKRQSHYKLCRDSFSAWWNANSSWIWFTIQGTRRDEHDLFPFLLGYSSNRDESPLVLFSSRKRKR